ncbi:MAG: hypothetical protein MI919_30915 [Holophagales bacterium]|nr:hypothetical protein [Holophagales bacterium]
MILVVEGFQGPDHQILDGRYDLISQFRHQELFVSDFDGRIRQWRGHRRRR